MGMRAINSAVISFGLVTIPAKVYSSAVAETVSFNMVSPAGNRVAQKLFDKVTDEEVQRNEAQKGYEYAKDQLVILSPEEIKSLETTQDKTIEIKEFVDLSSVDLLQVEKSFFLGPDKGGDKAYALLAATMRATNKVAVGQWASRGKEQLVLLRPYKNGLVLHQMFYASEMRDFDQVPMATMEVADEEKEVAEMLVEKLSTGAFDPSKYEDAYRRRALDAIEAKISGGVFTVPAAEAPKQAVNDLLAMLKASVEKKPDAAPSEIKVKRDTVAPPAAKKKRRARA